MYHQDQEGERVEKLMPDAVYEGNYKKNFSASIFLYGFQAISILVAETLSTSKLQLHAEQQIRKQKKCKLFFATISDK